jgi:hypothetical protein
MLIKGFKFTSDIVLGKISASNPCFVNEGNFYTWRERLTVLVKYLRKHAWLGEKGEI